MSGIARVRLRFRYTDSRILPRTAAFLLAALVFVITVESLALEVWRGLMPDLPGLAIALLLGGFVFSVGYRVFER